jgi:hypothetical protein
VGDVCNDSATSIWTDVEFWALNFRSALGRADKLINDGTEGSVESRRRLAPLGCISAGAAGAGGPRRNSPGAVAAPTSLGAVAAP